MQGHVYPVAPAGVQRPEGAGNIAPPAHRPFAEGGEHVESPGKSKSPMSKVKNKARKLKDKFKKVTGSQSTTNTRDGHGDLQTPDHPVFDKEHEIGDDHGERAYRPHPNIPNVHEHDHDDVDDGTDLYEDDDEEDDHILLGDDQSKYEQVQSLGAMKKPADASEVQVHGGVPASTLAATGGVHNDIDLTSPYKSAGPQENAPISPYKNAGPPNTLQAAPTEYHYRPAKDDEVFEDVSHEQPKPSQIQDMPFTSYNTDPSLVQRNPSPSEYVPYTSFDNAPSKPSPSYDMPYTSYPKGPEDSSLGAGFLGLPTSTNVKRLDPSLFSSSTDTFSPREPASSDSSTKSGMNEAYPDDIVKPNPEFGRLSSPMHNKIAVINENLPAETRQDVGLAPEDSGSQSSLLDKSVPENAPTMFGETDKSVERPVSDAVAGAFLTSPADAVPTSTYGMTGGPKFDVNAEEDERGIPYTGACSLGKDESESTPLLTAAIGAGSDTLAKDAWLADKMTKPSDVGTTGQSFDSSERDDGRGISLFETDEMDKPTDVATGGRSFYSKEHKDGKGLGGVRSFGKDESEEPPISAIGDERSDDRTPSDENLLYEDASPFNQNVAGDDASRQTQSAENVRYDDARGQSPMGRDVEPAKTEQEGWGKWSADKLNNAKNAVTSTLIGSDEKSAEAVGMSEAHDGDVGTDEGKRLHDPEETNRSLDGNVPMNENEDEEYYDPNNANDSQFQEGFALGTGEAQEEALNSTLAGSAIGKFQVVATKLGLSGNTHPGTPNAEDVSSPQAESEKSEPAGIVQGLRNTVASTLGYGGLSPPKPSHEQEVNKDQAFPSENEQTNAAHRQQQSDVSSPQPESEKSEPTGIVQGLRNTVASTFGYGGPSSPKTTHEQEVSKEQAIPSEDEQANAAHSQQHSGGALQGWKNVFASKLGYGVSEAPRSDETMYDESGEHANAVKAGHDSLNEERERTPADRQQTGGAMQGLKNVVASKLGYGGALQKPADDNAMEATRDVRSQDEVSPV